MPDTNDTVRIGVFVAVCVAAFLLLSALCLVWRCWRKRGRLQAQVLKQYAPAPGCFLHTLSPHPHPLHTLPPCRMLRQQQLGLGRGLLAGPTRGLLLAGLGLLAPIAAWLGWHGPHTLVFNLIIFFS